MGFLDDHKTLAIATAAATGGALAFWTLSSQRRRCQLDQFQNLSTTDFDSFLKMPIDNPTLTTKYQRNNDINKKRKYAATSFDAYLAHTDSSSSSSSHLLEPVDGAAPSPPKIESVPRCPPDAVPVTILYGTEFGFSREIAEKLYQRVENYSGNNNNNNGGSRNRYWPELLNLADFPKGFCLEKCQVALIASSTQGDGVPPTEVREFCSWLLGPTAPNLKNEASETSSSSLSSTPPAPAAGTATTPVRYSVLALGDRSYTHFARCGKNIDARLEELGAVRFVPRVDVDKEDWIAIDGWIEAVVVELDLLDLQNAQKVTWNGVLNYHNKATTISEDRTTQLYKKSTYNGGVPKETRWSKSKPYFATVIGVESLCNLSTPQSISHSTSTIKTTATSIVNSQKLDILNGYISNSSDNSDNSKKTTQSEKNTVRMEIDLGIDSGIDYLPGDALGVWPTNDPRDVDDLVTAAGFTEEKVLVKVPSWHYQDEELKKHFIGDGNSFSTNPGLITLEEALTRCYDLKTPKPGLLQLLSHKLAALKEGKNVATRSCNGVYYDSSVQKYLAGRHIADILRDWKPVRLTVEELLSVMRQLQPRLYSISSSPLEKPAFASKLSDGVPVKGVDTAGHRTVQLTVAVLKYESIVGKSRVGVASTYLAERSQWQQQQQQNGYRKPQQQLPPQPFQEQNIHDPQLIGTAKVPVYLYKNPDFRLPFDMKTPIIMVGPGTGVAPFRGFIQHRKLVAAAAAAEEKKGNDDDKNASAHVLGPALLFFGCRRRDEDYLYGSELENLAKTTGQIQLFTAFSREESQKKMYVQDRLVENGSLVWQLLEAGGVFYVCGDGSRMAGDVETALKSIIQQYQGQGSAAAEDYFENLVKSGCYKRDVWGS
jgi:sulfite reductase (NADPH) flavoprotein alpha-component